ncbi:MAG TPA: entericidin A/B family lipoprotein [Allosphingosinicella sp.]|nr:entericidin A/B family lipoprotein [Allosphingosinicella sp.]
MVRKLVLVLTLGSSLVLSACNTIAGLGRDVESAGDCVEDVATGKKC